MDRLWSPWRLAYITGNASDMSSSAEPVCIFCAAAAALESPESSAPHEPGTIGPTDLILARGDACYVILNLYPYNNGHLMVVPKRHIGSLAAATADELSE